LRLKGLTPMKRFYACRSITYKTFENESLTLLNILGLECLTPIKTLRLEGLTTIKNVEA